MCRYIAADVGHQRNQCGLAHIGTFTAHVRTGDDQHAALRRQIQRVGDKWLIQYLFNYRMATFGNANARFINEGRAGVVQGIGPFRQVNQHVECRQRARALLQRFQMRQQQVEQLFIKLFFQCQCFAF